jgi:NAD(P)-dependent dehydrogenase (short-subunit alcohol dehydrogenase family)
VTTGDPSARVALVTGCGKALGIGSATARELARRGCTVVVSDVAPAGAANDLDVESDRSTGWQGIDSLVDEIEAHGGHASSTLGDVSVEADAQRMVADAVARHGRLDILVNNAGAPHGDDRGDIEQVTLAAWERVMAVNVRGVFLMSRAAVRPMRAQRWGRIVNIASAVVKHTLPHKAAYTASKAAVVGFTQALALDVAEWGITVNAVCPGSTRTARAMSSTRKAGWDDLEAGLRERAKGIPVGRHAEADEIAAAIAFLASDASAYVTGTSLFVDGGGLPR